MQERAVNGVAYLVGIVAGLATLSTFGFIDVWDNGIYGNDFSEIWAGPHVFATGHNPYDPNYWPAAIAELGVQRAGLPTFNYPGWIPIVLWPLGTIDLEPAARIWIGVTLFLGAAGLFLLLDHFTPRLPLAFTLFAYALVASEPGIVTFYSGQWGFLQIALLSAMAIALHRRRDAIAGALGVVMAIKPHLFLSGSLMLMRSTWRRSARFSVALVTAVGILALASTIAFPTWWVEYLSVPIQKSGDVRAAALPNAMRDVFGDVGLDTALVLIGIVLALAFRFSPRSETYLPVWLAVTLLTPPYIFVYDHILTIVPLVVATGVVARRVSTAHALAFAAAGFAILVAGGTFVHAYPAIMFQSNAVNGFVLYAVVILVIATLWRWRADESDNAIVTSPATPTR